MSVKFEFKIFVWRLQIKMSDANLKKRITLTYTLKMEINYKTFVKFLNEHFAEEDGKDTFHLVDEESKEAWAKFLEYFKTKSKKLQGSSVNIANEPEHEGSGALRDIVAENCLESGVE